MGSVRIIACLALLVGCSHEARRDNPFDPELTPAVALTVALDDTAGTARLEWSRYTGDAAFHSYRVLRNVAQSTVVDTLTTLLDVGQTTYTDSSLANGTAYAYRVSVFNLDGFEAASPAQEVPALRLPGVGGLRAAFDSRTATASLVWTPYAGPRFAAYELRRRRGEAVEVVTRLQSAADTTFTDSGLLGDTEYTYQVVVVTQTGEEVPGSTVSGRFHELVAEWPLDLQDPLTTPASAFVRLGLEPGNRIAATVADSAGTRVLSFDPGGGVESEEPLYGTYPPTTVGSALDGQGRRVFASRTLSTGHVGLHRLGADGRLLVQERALFASALPEPLEAEEGVVLGEVTLRVGESSTAQFDSLTITVAGEVLYEEDFSFLTGAGDLSPGEGLTRGGWLFTGSFVTPGSGSPGLFLHGGGGATTARRADPSWRDLRLAVDVTGPSGAGVRGPATVQIGGDTYSRFRLLFDERQEEVRLEWSFVPPAGSDRPARAVTVAEPFSPPTGVPYRLALGVEDGRFAATLADPVWVRVGPTEPVLWSSLTPIGDWLAFTVDERLYAVSPDGQADLRATLDSPVAEVRAWQFAGQRRPLVAVCLPHEDRVLWGTAIVPSRWELALRQGEVGPHLPSGGTLFYPLSAAGGPDGRLYVLDAANHRIVVFDEDGGYITHWGSRGSGPGQFDFGDGEVTLGGRNHAGSLAVDEDGFIYVAEVFNRRVQKFAP